MKLIPNFLKRIVSKKEKRPTGKASQLIQIYKEEQRKKPKTERIKGEKINSIQSALLDQSTENPDYVLSKKGTNIYDEMEERDTHLYATYQTRKLAVSTLPWEILVGSEDEKSYEIRDFVFDAIDNCKGIFSEDIKQIMDAVGKGFSALEIIWQYLEKGKWAGKYTVEELVFHKQKYWRFIPASISPTGKDIALYTADKWNPVEIPWTKLIHYAYDSQDSKYGRGAFRPCYWFYWFKKEGWKSWMIYLSKYGQPTTIGTYPDGAKVAEQNLLMDVINSIQEETGLIIPESMKLSFLESSRSSPASYENMVNACNAEISKAILGATQTVEEGKRGSYALSRAHSEVRQERVAADGVDVADTIQQQLVRPLVDFNYITDVYPQFILVLPDTEIAESKIKQRKVVSPTESTEPTKPETKFYEIDRDDLRKSVHKVLQSVVKNIDAGQEQPIVNVGPIKKVLNNKYSEEKAFEMARKVKNWVEPRIDVKKDNLFLVFSEAFDQLCSAIVTK